MKISLCYIVQNFLYYSITNHKSYIAVSYTNNFVRSLTPLSRPNFTPAYSTGIACLSSLAHRVMIAAATTHNQQKHSRSRRRVLTHTHARTHARSSRRVRQPSTHSIAVAVAGPTIVSDGWGIYTSTTTTSATRLRSLYPSCSCLMSSLATHTQTTCTRTRVRLVSGVRVMIPSRLPCVRAAV